MESYKDFEIEIKDSSSLESVIQLWPSGKDSNNYPHDNAGIRILGGKDKESGRIFATKVRFSQDPRFGWEQRNMSMWLRNHNYIPRSLANTVESSKFKTLIRSDNSGIFKRMPMMITKIVDKVKWRPGDPLVIEGIVSSNSIDTYGEIVDQDAIMDSKEFYMKFPTVRYMHMPEPIGKTLDIWRDGEKTLAKMFLSASAVDVITKIIEGIIKAFSIGFLWMDGEYRTINTDKGDVEVFTYTKIKLIEISPVDSPANRDAEMTNFYLPDEETIVEEESIDNLDTSNPSCSCLNLGNYHTTEAPSIALRTITGGNSVEKTPETEEVEEQEPVAPEEPAVPEEQPAPETPEEEVPPVVEEPEEPAEESELAAKVLQLEKELDSLKQAEEKRKKAQEIEEAVKAATESLLIKNTELNDRVRDLEKQLAAKEAVEHALNGLPAKRESFGSQGDGTPDTAEADVRAANILERAARLRR